MTENVSRKLFLEHMRVLRARLERIEHKVDELKTSQIAMRGDFHNLRGDFLRLERALATVEIDIDRINARLGLADPATPPQ